MNTATINIDSMKVDLSLIQQAEFLANGRHVHKVANLVAGYRGTYEWALESPDPESIDLFKEAERRLLAFVAKKRKERYQNNKDLQQSIENIRTVRKAARRVVK